MIKTHTTTELIAKEGWGTVSIFFVLFLISLGIGFLPWVFLFLFLSSLFVYRNFERIPNQDDRLALLSPVDGKIINISKVITKDNIEFLKLEIRKTIFDVSLVRSPILAKLSSVKRVHGLFLDSQHPDAKKLNERAVLKLDSGSKQIIIIITAGFFSRSIELFKSVGPLKSAQRFGLLLDGSVELLLPIDTSIKVSVADSVRAGESVLGYFSYGKSDDNSK